MRNRSSEPSRWYFLPPESKDTGWSRGLALVTLVILVFFTLGLLVSAFVDANRARSGKSLRAQPGISSLLTTGH